MLILMEIQSDIFDVGAFLGASWKLSSELGNKVVHCGSGMRQLTVLLSVSVARG